MFLFKNLCRKKYWKFYNREMCAMRYLQCEFFKIITGIKYYDFSANNDKCWSGRFVQICCKTYCLLILFQQSRIISWWIMNLYFISFLKMEIYYVVRKRKFPFFTIKLQQLLYKNIFSLSRMRLYINEYEII